MDNNQKPKLVATGTQETKQAIPPKTVSAKAEVDPKQAAAKPAVTLPSQREAVFVEVMKIVKEEKLNVAPGQTVKSVLSEIQTKKICAALASGFRAKRIALKETESNKQKLSDDKAMELYCLGLLNNWLRRDKRLNGVGEKTITPKQ